MRGCISERLRIKSDGKRKIFSESKGNCTWRFNKYQWKRHLLQPFQNITLKDPERVHSYLHIAI